MTTQDVNTLIERGSLVSNPQAASAIITVASSAVTANELSNFSVNSRVIKNIFDT